jgi:hypothetical protein
MVFRADARRRTLEGFPSNTTTPALAVIYTRITRSIWDHVLHSFVVVTGREAMNTSRQVLIGPMQHLLAILTNREPGLMT